MARETGVTKDVIGQITPLDNNLQVGPHFQVTTHTVQSGLINTRSAPVWASYLGSTGDDRLLGIALDPSIDTTSPNPQPIVAVGFTQNTSDSTDFEGLVARFSTDGTQATKAMLDPGTGNRLEIHSATVDPNDGSIYVNGQATINGTTSDTIARVHADLSVVDWQLSHTPNSEAHGTSVKLDSTGTNLYATGDVDGNTYVTQLTDLTTAQPTVVVDKSIVFNDPNGNPVTSTGNGITPDANGNVDLAGQVQTSPDTEPVVVQVDPTVSTINWGARYPSMGPNGTMNGVYIDNASNTLYVTGGVGISNPPLVDEAIDALDSSGNEINTGFIRIYAQGGGQFLGYSVQTDASGNIFTGVTDEDANGETDGGNMAFVEVDPGFNNILQTHGDAFGSNDDQLRGMALDSTNSALYMAGYTNSPDFSNTTGSFQPTYGGDPFDGVVVAYNVT
jgi:hypothetical protein